MKSGVGERLVLRVTKQHSPFGSLLPHIPCPCQTDDSLEAAFSAALGARLTPGPVRPSPAFDLAWSPSRRILETLIIQETSAPPTPAPGATRGAGLGLGQQERRLAERLERLSLDMVVMSGDGNCQVRQMRGWVATVVWTMVSPA